MRRALGVPLAKCSHRSHRFRRSLADGRAHTRVLTRTPTRPIHLLTRSYLLLTGLKDCGRAAAEK